ncbi:MAG: transcription antitermination factor NusB [Deferribacteraceae bacterium]|jgi:N utilization substance protein B|nr:transcription antitermination factor NusB [Deferribacteraceae bacterium]
MKARTQAREYAVQMMYQAELLDSDPLEVNTLFWKSIDDDPDNEAGSMPAESVMEFAQTLFTSAFSRRVEHDRTVAMFLKENWPFERLGEMEKCILRVAVDELLHYNTPDYAVLDEYVTLTRRFTDEKTAAFVNGLLENIRNTLKKEG